MLRVDRLEKTFVVTRGGRREAVRAVDGVSLAIQRGESVGLVGASGSGKSTVARLIAGLLNPDGGSVTFWPEEGVAQRELSPPDLGYRRFVQILHQNPDVLLHPRATVAELCRDSMELWGSRCRFDRMEDFLTFCSLDTEQVHQYPSTLSGGERRRVGLARVLAGRPELVLADEVVSGLDRMLQAEMLRHLQRLRAEGLSLLVISHDLELVRLLCDRVLVMSNGRIVDVCPAHHLLLGARVHHPYTTYLLQAESFLPCSNPGANAIRPPRVIPPRVRAGIPRVWRYIKRRVRS